MARIEIAAEVVEHVDHPWAVKDVAGEADPDTGEVRRIVRVSFFDVVRRGRAEQGGEVDACTELLGAYLPGASLARLAGTVDEFDLLVEVVVDARDLFDTLEYDLAHDLEGGWGEGREELESALALWRERDLHPRPNQVV